MQETTGVAVLATHLAHTDRRALSQAWYSALHLADPAQRAPLTAGARSSPGAVPGSARGPHPAAARDGLNRGSAGARGPDRANARRDPFAEPCERRMPKTELARRIERALTRRSPRERAASFAVRTAGGRVHLVVRCDGARTRVVAVCAPPLRERVERALAQARFALAGCGVRAEAA
ncbi:MAG TPA: hypothetical protein VGD01_07670 [Candidatus Elarobacter sp.]|jgi:hypothetical protein